MNSQVARILYNCVMKNQARAKAFTLRKRGESIGDIAKS